MAWLTRVPRELAGGGRWGPKAVAILLVLFGATFVALRGPAQRALQVMVPEEIADPSWLAARGAEQRARLAETQLAPEFVFSDELDASGIAFRHRIVDDAGRAYKAVHYDHGNGLAAADVDGDDLPDLYFVTQAGRNELWRNLGGGRFEDVTERAGVAVADAVSAGASFADFDNDGDADLYVTTVRGRNRLFRNDGQGRFDDVSAEAGVGYEGHSSGALFFDYDRDGLLDLFVANVGRYTTDERRDVVGFSIDGSDDPTVYCVGIPNAFAGHLDPERDESSILFRNLGDGRFADVTEEVGLRDVGWTGDASPLDANDDGFPDLYVLNMQGADRYFENRGGGRFVSRGDAVFPRTPWGSMGIKVLDYDNDGALDIFVTDMHSDMGEPIGPWLEKAKARVPPPAAHRRGESHFIYGNALFHKLGPDRFEEVSDAAGAENYWPWGPSAGDVNADGFQDLFIASSMNLLFRYAVNTMLLNDRGQVFLDAEFALGIEPRRGGRTAVPWFEFDCAGLKALGGRVRNQLKAFCRDGLRRRLAATFGPAVAWGAIGSRSSAILDLDGDGDLDIVTNDFNSAPMLLVSNLDAVRPPRYLKIHLVGTRSNRDGLGARVSVRTSAGTLVQAHDGKSGYLSQSRLQLYFGLGEAQRVDAVEVIWPSGTRQVLEEGIGTNRTLRIEEPDGRG